MDLVVKVPYNDGYQVYLIFDSERIVLPLSFSKMNRYSVKIIPSYQTGTITSNKVKDGKVFYEETEFQGQNNYSLKFEPCRLTDLKE